MLYAIKSLKQNRSLLKKRKLKSKDDLYGINRVTKLVFKRTSPLDLDKVRAIIKKERKRIFIINLIAATLTFAIVILMVCYAVFAN